MTYLLRIHIVPVQEFITAARRSRDLWFGSWLLSELSKAAAAGIVDTQPAGLDCLVFPAPEDRDALRPRSPLEAVNVGPSGCSYCPRPVEGEKNIV